MAILLMMPGQAAWAQSTRTIKIVVPFPPGASVDAVGRLAAAGLQQRLNTNVIVENRPGASGSIGSAVVAKSPSIQPRTLATMCKWTFPDRLARNP